jgi:hypothetical protein
MKTYLLTSLLALCSISVFATHSGTGTEVYIEKTGNNTYKFTLTRYGIQASITSVTFSTNAPNTGSITLNRVSYKPASAVNCPFGYGEVSVGVFEGTAQFTSIPPNGITIESDNNQWSGFVNIAIDHDRLYSISKIYPGFEKSAQFFENSYLQSFSNSDVEINMGAFNGNHEDSLHFSFSNVNALNSLNGFEVGYSQNSPFGNSVTTTINPNTGLVMAKNVPNGHYFLGVNVDSYRNGNKVSTINRQVPIYVKTPASSLPEIDLTTVSFTGLDSSKIGNNYYFEMSYSDTLRLNLFASSTNNDSIVLRGLGNLLTNNDGNSGNCAGLSCAQYSLVGGSAGQTMVQGQFEFTPDSNFVDVNSNFGYAHFVFQAFQSDSCKEKRNQNLGLYIRVKRTQSIYSTSGAIVCNGQPFHSQILGDTTNLQWYPSTGVSNPTSASPLLSPSQNTTYTIVNLNNGDSISLKIEVGLVQKPILNISNATLSIPNNKAFDEVTTYYNGTAVYQVDDSLQVNLVGDYYSEGILGNCSSFSDSIKHSALNKIALSNAQKGAAIKTSGHGKKVLKFNFPNRNYQVQKIRMLSPISAYNKTSSAPELKLLDLQGQLLKSVSGTYANNQVWEFNMSNQPFTQGDIYILELTMSETEVVLFKPQSLPFSDNANTFVVTAAEYSDYGVMKSDAFPYLDFEFSTSIAIVENELFATLYPNPVKDILYIETAEPCTLTLMDLNGRSIHVFEIKSTSNLDLSGLAQGAYLYELINALGYSKNGKLIKL